MPRPINSQPDPFGKARRKDGVLVNEFQGKPVPLILRHEHLRNVTKDSGFMSHLPSCFATDGKPAHNRASPS